MEEVVAENHIFDNYIWSNDVLKHTSMAGPKTLQEKTVGLDKTKPKEIEDIEWLYEDDSGADEVPVADAFAPISAPPSAASIQAVDSAVHASSPTSFNFVAKCKEWLGMGSPA